MNSSSTLTNQHSLSKDNESTNWIPQLSTIVYYKTIIKLYIISGTPHAEMKISKQIKIIFLDNTALFVSKVMYTEND